MHVWITALYNNELDKILFRATLYVNMKMHFRPIY